ncbi:methylmalonyl Co-A mutase-associated GTPase MeaB [Candidatus Neomarinimicrobiota bacterium]
MSTTLVTQIIDGSTLAISRAISLVENESPEALTLLDDLFPQSGATYRIGITGPPGAGKSTLVDQLIGYYRKAGEKVGIISVDPSSPFSGGAVLGDRLRMSRHYLDTGVFIRSMATRGEMGGLAARSQEVGDILGAAGYTFIIYETVGVGQIELDVVEAVDTTVVVLVPESGDEVQLMKAGLIEIADIFVINKSDREGANQIALLLEQLLGMKEDPGSVWAPPLCQTSAVSGMGIEELKARLDEHHDYVTSTGRYKEKRRARMRRRVKEMISTDVMGTFWTSERLTKLEDDLETESPFLLSQKILEMN